MKGSRYNLCPIQIVPDIVCSRYNLFPIQYVPDTVCSRYSLFPIQFVPIQFVPIQIVPIQFVHEPLNLICRPQFSLCWRILKRTALRTVSKLTNNEQLTTTLQVTSHPKNNYHEHELWPSKQQRRHFIYICCFIRTV